MSILNAHETPPTNQAMRSPPYPTLPVWVNIVSKVMPSTIVLCAVVIAVIGPVCPNMYVAQFVQSVGLITPIVRLVQHNHHRVS